MERKIGEIFEYNGEWYQCVGGTCRNCSFYYDTVCKNFITIGSTIIGNCDCTLRTDHKCVIFKKLEKVGEPILYGLRLTQRYKVSTPVEMPKDPSSPCMSYNLIDNLLYIEIKQNKEDMEEKNKAKHSNSEKIGKNLKEFDLEAAKAGKPVCTRNGHKARIICFDAKSSKPVIALITRKSDDYEEGYSFYEDGRACGDKNNDYDLMMLSEKKEGWVNVYKKEQNRYVKGIFPSREIALNSISEKSREYIATIKITWEE